MMDEFVLTEISANGYLARELAARNYRTVITSVDYPDGSYDYIAYHPELLGMPKVRSYTIPDVVAMINHLRCIWIEDLLDSGRVIPAPRMERT